MYAHIQKFIGTINAHGHDSVLTIMLCHIQVLIMQESGYQKIESM